MARPTLESLAKLQRQSLGFLLIRCGQLLNERGMAKVNAEGSELLMREAHSRLIPYLQTPLGIRVTDLGRKLGTSKQGAQQLVAQMLKLELVELKPDPTDARAKRVVLTSHGIAAVMKATGKLVELDQDVAVEMTKAERKLLHAILQRLVVVLERV